jgi:hypothetical protein
MPNAETSAKSPPDIPTGPAWLPPKDPPGPAPRWVNGRSFPAVWRDTLPFVMGGLIAATKTHPQLRPGGDWTAQPEPDSEEDVDQAIAAKLHIGLRIGTVLAESQLAIVKPREVAVIPEWGDVEEAASYASKAKLPVSPLFLDFEAGNGGPTAWEAETWPLPLHLRGAVCWITDGLLSVVPYGSVGGVHPWGGTDYQAWARWAFIQDERPEWPSPGPGDFIASADSRVTSWVDPDGESICAQQGAVAFNLTQRVLRVLWALETVQAPLVTPSLPRPERRRAKRAKERIGLIPEGLPRLPETETSTDERPDDDERMTASCPVPRGHSALNQAHLLWHEALDAYNDPELFVTKLNALIQAMRNVTWALQKDLGRFPATKEWYENWQDRMRADPLMAWLKEARNHVVKKGDLETHSKARVMVVGEMLRGKPVDIDVDPAAPVDDIARRLKISGVSGRAAQEGTLVVERRWTVDALPDQELLEVLAHCYGVLARILDECHDQLELSIATCEQSANDPCGLTGTFMHPSGRPGCMWAGKQARTSRRDLSSGAPVRAKIASVVGPSVDIEAVRERYAAAQLEPAPEGADVFEQGRILHEQGRAMLLIDEEHVMIALLLRDGKALRLLSLEPRDQREKYLTMDAIASEATRLGANELILSAEAWEAPPVDADDPRANLPARERDDRGEAFTTHIVRRNGGGSSWRSVIRRGPDGIELEEAEELKGAVPHALLPVLEAWEDWS